ncbi:hypothetical protein E2C01_063289 [Portunus trituberculatus]|uniref:Uncharacterized protein n=1 Tax=Portunus trituberculatus TaxID=210409 RepID=A0A5B7HKE6_PORTR|nr:hypothetical protein [Portunus trituberculatus]
MSPLEVSRSGGKGTQVSVTPMEILKWPLVSSGGCRIHVKVSGPILGASGTNILRISTPPVQGVTSRLYHPHDPPAARDHAADKAPLSGLCNEEEEEEEEEEESGARLTLILASATLYSSPLQSVSFYGLCFTAR